MNLVKSYELFKPEQYDDRVHIIGCGSIGSTMAENLARCGIKNFSLWDFDTVDEHNVSNQMFRSQDIGKLKVEALSDIISEINPDAKESIELHPKGWNGESLSGFIILCPDSIDVRKSFVEKHMDSPYIKAVFDFRTELYAAQHFAADWLNYKMKKNLYASMDFTSEEASESTPVSACGISLGLSPTVRGICAIGTANFINFWNGEPIKKTVFFDIFHMSISAFE